MGEHVGKWRETMNSAFTMNGQSLFVFKEEKNLGIGSKKVNVILLSVLASSGWIIVAFQFSV